MSDDRPLVEHWGTFELANYGDLLYPLVLDHHLARALPTARTRLVGPIGGRAPMGLDRPVRRAVRHDEEGFWHQAADVDAIVLGGGDLVHPLVGVTEGAGQARRLDAWAFAARSNLLAEVRPMIWNGVGVPFDVPDELAGELRASCSAVELLAVRDEASRRRLEAAGVDRDIEVVPDTGVLVDAVFTPADRARAAEQLRVDQRLPGPGTPIVAVHGSFGSPASIAELAGAIREGCSDHAHAAVVLLEMGVTHGDRATLRAVADHLDLPTWTVHDPTLLEVTAVLDLAEVTVTSSFHALLVSSVLGTASIGFLQHDYRPSKLGELVRALDREQWLVERPSRVGPALDAALTGGGKPDVERVEAMCAGARAHLDRVSDHLARATPRSVDVGERDAAHRHAIAELTSAREREARLLTDLHVVDRHLRSARSSARTWEAAFWRLQARAAVPDLPAQGPLDLGRLTISGSGAPGRWATAAPAFHTPGLPQTLACTFPRDEAEVPRTTRGAHRIRCLLPMARSTPPRPHALDPAWRLLVDQLAGPAYRDALSRLTGVDLAQLDLEVNALAFGPGDHLEPQRGRPEEVVSHVLWLNEAWEPAFGGCLRILHSDDRDDLAQELVPGLGWSTVLVHADTSWHCVTPVGDGAPEERRVVIATFHRPGSVSSIWGGPPD